jgi:hypothetical protein
MPEPLVLAMVAFGLLSLLLLGASLAAVRRRRWIGTSAALLSACLFLALAALAATLGVATKGYRALTREEVAAVITTKPTGPERFVVTFAFPDGRRENYELSGNGLYVDAHIVKWHPWANVLGLHTAYQLDRVGGRYDRIEDELRKPRTIFALSPAKPVDLFQVARSLAFLGGVVDAESGAALGLRRLRRTELHRRLFDQGAGRVPNRPHPPGRLASDRLEMEGHSDLLIDI